MPLSPGTRLGLYEITAQIGAGGMGEVHRARDLTLQRDVAIKTLPQAFLSDPDRLARFEREAQTLAALNHPHIAHIHGVICPGDGGPALVMELVEGEDLAQRISRGAIPLDEALPIARQVADALQAAHEQGIIHRDLKPANVKLRPDGTVKVLDFGLAKAMDPTAGMTGADMAHSPTITSARTEAGIILGTAAYMAPEQARGRAVDRRADIWAFGCLLFEMLTGRRAFAGDDVTDTITAVLRDEPDWSLLPPGLSPSIGQFLRRCFAKNPRERVQDAGDLRLALDGAFDLPAARSADPSAPARRRWGPVVGGALAIALLAGTAGWGLRPALPPPDERLRRFAISPSPGTLSVANTNRDIAISPDGSLIAYLANEGSARHLYVRRLDSLTPTLLRRADRYYEPFVSHDSRWIAFNDEADFTLRKIAVTGGPPVTIAPLGAEMLGATWGDDDTIVYATVEGLWRVPAGGGTPASLLKPDPARGELLFSWPVFLPGSKTVLYAVRSGALSEWTVNAVDLQTGGAKILVRGATNPVFSPTGHLLYMSDQTLHGIAFDAVRVETRGNATPLFEGILAKVSGGADVAISSDGTLVYVSGTGPVGPRDLLWLDRAGRTESLGAPQRPYNMARVSPDGSHIVLDIRDGQGDLWMWDVGRKVLSRLTTYAGFDGVPLWTRDGRQVIYSSVREGPQNLFMQAADGTGTPRRIVAGDKADYAVSVTRDSTQVIFRRDGMPGTGTDLMSVRIDGRAPEAVPLLDSKANELNGEVSPDGRWIAYESDYSGLVEVYVRPFPRVDTGRWQISYGSGFQPMWSPDSLELFFADADGRLNGVRVTPGTAFVASRPEPVRQVPMFTATIPRPYDISPDGKRFLIIQQAAASTQQSHTVTVVENWTQELKRMTAR